MATLNREAWLDKAFENIREYIRPEDELIIVDGGSKDRTLEIIEKNRDIVTTLISEPDKGEAHASNKALLAARGEIIKVITDDDYIFPDAMHKATRFMLDNPDVDAVICSGQTYSTRRGWTGDMRAPEGIPMSDSFIFPYRYRIICGLGLLFRRSVISKVGLFDIRTRAIDIDYLSKIYLHKLRVEYLDVMIYKHFHHEGSNTTTFARQCNRDTYRALMAHKYYWQAFLRVVRNWNALPGRLLYTGLVRTDRLIWKLREKKYLQAAAGARKA